MEKSGDPMEAMEDFPVLEVPEPSKKSSKKCASCCVFTMEKRKLYNSVKMLPLKLKDRTREQSIYVKLFL